MDTRWERGPVPVAVAAVAPIAISAALVPFRDNLDNANFALVLVLVVVAVSAVGNRVAGVVAAVLAGAAFDFFFTVPYERLSISDGQDLGTALLLLVVGIGVTELAVWGRTQHARAERDAGYLAGLAAAATVGATGGSPAEVIDHVSQQLVQTLGLRSCRFQYDVAGLGAPPRLGRDGQVTWKQQAWDVEAQGLPSEADVELLAESGGVLRGRFLLSAAAGSRPSLNQRLVAVALADQVGASVGHVT